MDFHSHPPFCEQVSFDDMHKCNDVATLFETAAVGSAATAAYVLYAPTLHALPFD